MKIYLAGPITGCIYDECNDWREQFRGMISESIKCLSPMRGEEYLKKKGIIEDCYPDEGPFATQRGLMARDFYDCTKSDAIVANLLGAKQISIGTCMEIGWCYITRNPLIVIMEKKNNLHDHPMIREAMDYRVTSLQEAVEIVETLLLPDHIYATN